MKDNFDNDKEYAAYKQAVRDGKDFANILSLDIFLLILGATITILALLLGQ